MRAIELGWIARFDKSLPLPQLVFGPDNDCGGKYFAPMNGEEIIGQRHIDSRNGIIFISTTFWMDFAENIAHEWRHHWQVFHGMIYDGIGWNRPADYDKAIIAYFTKSASEADALRFQRKRAGCCEAWIDLLSHAEFDFGT